MVQHLPEQELRVRWSGRAQGLSERRLRVLAFPGERLHAAVITMRGGAVHVISFREANEKEARGMKNRKDDLAARLDKDNSEWTAAEIKNARPALDVVSEVFGAHESEALRRG